MAENQNSFEFTTRERCAALISEDNTYDGLAAVTAQRQNYNAIRTLDGASPVVTATITDGALPLTGSARILVDTEGQAPADDLETIPVSGNDAASGTVALCPDGAIVYLKAKDESRAVTVKNTSNVNGIQTYSGNDVVLSAKAWTSFQLQDGTWRQCVATDSENLLISSQYVKTTGTQTIGGVKTFTSAITASGGVTGNVTGNCTGSSGSCTGNAASATKLQTARNINGVAFNGTANITIKDGTKVALDGSNLSSASQTLTTAMAHAAMPSARYIDLSLTKNDWTYTAPADGYIAWHFAASTVSYFRLWNTTSDIISGLVGVYNGYQYDLFAPVKKGDIVKLSWQVAATTYTLKFIYAEGAY